MYFITILFDIQCYDFVSRAPSRYYNFSLVILRVNISLHLEGDTVPTHCILIRIMTDRIADGLRLHCVVTYMHGYKIAQFSKTFISFYQNHKELSLWLNL